MADKKRNILEFVEQSNFEQFTPTQTLYYYDDDNYLYQSDLRTISDQSWDSSCRSDWSFVETKPLLLSLLRWSLKLSSKLSALKL
jgi:hypothetical protein